MKNKLVFAMKRIALLFGCLALALTATAQTDTGHAFPQDGKYYLINRNGNSSGYIYEDGQYLAYAASSTSQKQYWLFVPTANANCYYIKNATSGHYVQSSKITLNSQITTGTKPVEFKVVKNETSTNNGFYYICSTDQDIDASTDGTQGLNFQPNTSKVVSFYIRWDRGNSYWNITETTYDYETPLPPVHTDYQRQLGVYYLPCGATTGSYFSAFTLTGGDSYVYQSINYTATAAPSDAFTLVRKQPASVSAGGPFTITYDAKNIDSYTAVTAYFDWDADGVFEAKHEFYDAASGTQEITVPENAKAGSTVRLRMRITNNGLEDADQDASGQVLDFPVTILPQTAPTAIEPATLTPAVDTSDEPAYNAEGRRVNPAKHRGVILRRGQKVIQ